MSDDYFENDLFGRREDEGKAENSEAAAEAAEESSAAEETADTQAEATASEETASESAQPFTAYSEGSKAEPIEPYPARFEEAQPVSEQPAYTNPYAYHPSYPSQQARETANPYGNPYRPTTSVTQQPTAQRSPEDFNDGFYHQRFTSQDGNNVNYTRPVNDRYTGSVTGYTSPASGYSAPATGYHTQPATSQPPRRTREKSSGLSKGGIALLLIICILISGAAGFGGSMLASKINQPQYESTASDTMVIHKVNAEVVTGTESELSAKSTAEITAEVADTVVEVTTEVMQTSAYYGQYIAQGAGSGVIISEDGYILTNNHVIEDATSITVTTRGGDSYEATLVGTDSEVDIALLKIDATGLPVAVFGDSDALEVGAKAVIIGNPLGTLGGSVTEGIISALDRSIVIDGKTMHLMQTDAAINPGNSGGGMFNDQGELAGIVVAKSSSEEIDNIGFVIPINNVLDILGDLKDYGYVRGRADTGMTFIDLTNPMYAWYYYRNSEAGVYISSVESGSNADEAGFRSGDRVISVDGQTVSSSDDIESVISQKSAGDTVSFELDRSGSKGTLELTLDEAVPDSLSSRSTTTYDDNPFGFFGR